VQDPGNVGTIWRTADALGADGLILLEGCADPWSAKTVRSTMGACFRLPVYELGREQLADRMAASDLPLYATALLDDTVDLRSADLSRCAVVIGSEGRGVSREVLALCHKTMKIPMRDRCESLNAAAAATVVLWEMAR
jgi:TrmH family RNA methyltransferase